MKNIMLDFKLVDSTYPNGSAYHDVSLGDIHLGHLRETDSGFTSHGWRKPVAKKDDALEKMRAAAVTERKRQIAALQAEIDTLEEFKRKEK